MQTSNGRLVAVIGGGRGIGETVCEQMAASGHRVVVADIDGDNARRVASKLGANHVGARLDISDEAAVAAFFADVERDAGPIAAMVCVAGLLILPGGERPLIKDMTLDNWERTFAVNTRGPFLCAREFVRRREAVPVADGRVVFFGSSAAQLGGYRSSAAYIAAKSAVLGFTKALARETAHMGITVNAVAPGLIDTDMLRGTVKPGTDLNAALAATVERIPVGRVGTTDDVAGAVAYLVSPAASYVTGNVIDVNGGYRMQ